MSRLSESSWKATARGLGYNYWNEVRISGNFVREDQFLGSPAAGGTP